MTKYLVRGKPKRSLSINSLIFFSLIAMRIISSVKTILQIRISIKFPNFPDKDSMTWLAYGNSD